MYICIYMYIYTYIYIYLHLPCVQNFCRWFWGHVFMPLIPKNDAEIKFLPLGNLCLDHLGALPVDLCWPRSCLMNPDQSHFSTCCPQVA